MVELMIVVTIVAILTLVAVPMYMAQRKASMMSEGITAVGMIRTNMRIYAASHSNSYPTLNGVDGAGLTRFLVQSLDLSGKYFSADNYSVTSNSTGYTIRVTLSQDPAYWYEVDHAGNETRNNF